MTGQVGAIGPFVDEWYFLSNFFVIDVELDGIKYPSVEHAFQAAKTTNQKARATIRDARTPGQAKRLGRQVSLRSDWDVVRDAVMLDLLRKKFAEPRLTERLIATHDQPLIEINDWGDTYWGVCDGVGRNRLGELLQQVRSELRPG